MPVLEKQDKGKQVSEKQDKGKQVSNKQDKGKAIVSLVPKKKIDKRKGKGKKVMTKRQRIKLYFRHKNGQSRSQSNAIIIEYIKADCKRTLHEEKVRVPKKSKRTGKSLEELCQSYFNSHFWEGLLAFWKLEAHQHRSQSGINNRDKVQNLHSSGARPFQEVEEVIMKEERAGKNPTRLEVWDKTHTRVGSEVDENGRPRNYTTASAMEIASRYASILNEKGAVEEVGDSVASLVEADYTEEGDQDIGHECNGDNDREDNVDEENARENNVGEDEDNGHNDEDNDKAAGQDEDEGSNSDPDIGVD
ncbi:hypothetical protein POM88_023557 [Heracleum sosnowskyi]|uniref:Uncharacterized protein n=1 Tax=Heracleum sosnowskyi TaxID=360622 RepID=A0AAD8IHA0_9APIA|nr:hypothetical protein POM88_023557 [Heracleum sosnowskyi]